MIPDSNTRLLIVGGGIAAARLCEALRARGYAGGIEVLCGEDALPYDRPPLSKAALAQESDTTFPVDYDALTVAVRTGVTATGLDTAARVVYASDGEHPYDLLVIATGAEPVQVPGAAQHTLRTAADAGRLRSQLRPGARVALIGAGWIGAEIATAARGAGCEVVCVEAASAPLAKPIGADLGLRTLPWWSDVDLRLDTPVAEVTEQGLRLQCGTEVAADVVVTGVGVRPATTWLRDSGVELDPATGAVLVDEHLRANLSGVYAVGDVCARWSPRFGMRLHGEHWDEARTGPATVAAAVVGAVEPFDPVPYFWSDQFGHKLQFVGHRSPTDEPILRLGQGETWGVAWVDAEDRLTAHLSVDAPRYMVAARAAIEKNTVIDRDTVGDLTAPLRPRLPEPDHFSRKIARRRGIRRQVMTTATPMRIKSYDKLLIGGVWTKPSSDAVIDVISPITGERIATVPEAREADVDAAVAAARKAFDEGPWPRMTPAERAEILVRVGAEVKKRIPEMSAAFTAELGAPAVISTAFHQNAVDMWDDAATFHERFEFEQERTWKGGHGSVVREPVGVVATIIPWNGPVATASLKISPALAAGCTVVLKPAPEGPVSTMMLAEALAAAGLPEGVISVLPAGREVGEYLVSHKDVDKISFTGSTAAGSAIMGIAARDIKRVTLELGGKSAAIIADDVDLDEVFPNAVFAGIGHSGQVCAALTRFLVPRERQEEVVGRIQAVMESLKVGDPREEDTFLGPLAAERQQRRVLDYIEVGKQEGARLVTGGGVPANADGGFFVEPTLFADVSNDMRIAREEIFGPVLVVIPFDSIDEAVAIANDSDYGLSGAVYAKDQELAQSIARRVRTGQISVNSWAMCVVQPFGGYKKSGLGREGGLEGFDEFMETKLIQLP